MARFSSQRRRRPAENRRVQRLHAQLLVIDVFCAAHQAAGTPPAVIDARGGGGWNAPSYSGTPTLPEPVAASVAPDRMTSCRARSMARSKVLAHCYTSLYRDFAVTHVQGEQRGAPQRIRSNNGPEFTSRAYLAWAVGKKIEPVHIRPGKPIENTYVESFNGRPGRFWCASFGASLQADGLREMTFTCAARAEEQRICPLRFTSRAVIRRRGHQRHHRTEGSHTRKCRHNQSHSLPRICRNTIRTSNSSHSCSFGSWLRPAVHRPEP